MLNRPEGPDPPGICTCDDVKTWLAAAFMILPATPVYSVRKGEGTMMAPNVSKANFDWVQFSAEILGRQSRDRLYLLTWARVEARRRIQDMRRSRLRRSMSIAGLPVEPAGGSVADFCQEYGIRRSTFDRTVERVCDQLAQAWNGRLPPKTS